MWKKKFSGLMHRVKMKQGELRITAVAKASFRFACIGSTQVLFFMCFVNFKGVPKLHFMRYFCVVIILFNTALYKPAFSIYSFGKLVF